METQGVWNTPFKPLHLFPARKHREDRNKGKVRKITKEKREK